MYVNECFLDAKLDPKGSEGFTLTVTKMFDQQVPVPQELQTKQGPFNSIYLAQAYAMSWKDPAAPPELPTPEQASSLIAQSEQVPQDAQVVAPFIEATAKH